MLYNALPVWLFKLTSHFCSEHSVPPEQDQLSWISLRGSRKADRRLHSGRPVWGCGNLQRSAKVSEQQPGLVQSQFMEYCCPAAEPQSCKPQQPTGTWCNISGPLHHTTWWSLHQLEVEHRFSYRKCDPPEAQFLGAWLASQLTVWWHVALYNITALFVTSCRGKVTRTAALMAMIRIDLELMVVICVAMARSAAQKLSSLAVMCRCMTCHVGWILLKRLVQLFAPHTWNALWVSSPVRWLWESGVATKPNYRWTGLRK